MATRRSGDPIEVFFSYSHRDEKLRDKLLNGEIFETVLEARVLRERWRRHYNTTRPHSALGYRPPAPETIVPWPGSAVAPPGARAMVGLA